MPSSVEFFIGFSGFEAPHTRCVPSWFAGEGRRYKRVLQWVLETREASGELMPLVAARMVLQCFIEVPFMIHDGFLMLRGYF